MRSRLQQLLGPASPWVLQPHRSAVACVVAWLLSLPLTWHHPWLALLGFSAIWGLTLALWLEAPLLQSLPLPPLTVLLCGLCLRWGLGPLLLAVGGSGGDPFVEIWIRYGPPAQLLWLSLTAALLLLALPQWRAIARAARYLPQSSWLVEAIHQPRLRSQLRALAGVLSIYMAAYISLSMLSGAFDRQFDAYVTWTQQFWRLDTPVAAFSRLRDLWFLLFPLWWRLLSRPWRWFLGIELLSFFLAAFLSGSRGLLFYPVLLILLGLWFVLADPRILRRVGLIIAGLVLVLSPSISVLRDSNAFNNASGLSGRLAAVRQTLSQPELILDKSRWLGRDLYGCHDPYLFSVANRGKPRAGTRGLESVLHIWTPKHLFPNRPVIFDGHLTAKLLQYGSIPEWAKTWFPCLSLPADIFRRWGVPGVLFGSILVAALLQTLLRFWYQTASLAGNTFNLLLLLFPATYLQSFPFGTVSETAWVFLWELPKYLLLFWVIGACVDFYLKRKNA